jgi:hypothetical protein
MRRIRKHLTYANVISTLCLILLLGGGSALAAVVITSNSQVAKNTISGHNPPSGDHPNIIAGSVNGTDLSSAVKASLKLHCPRGLKRAADICFEPSLRTGASLTKALKTCATAGRRLPSAGELALVFAHLNTRQTGQWVSTPYDDNTGTNVQANGSTLFEDASRNIDFEAVSAGLAQRYRCVTSATN